MIFTDRVGTMKKTCLALAFCAGIALPTGASAADRTVVGVGTGAVAGALVGGPIGAVVGAVAGGFIGSNTPGVRHRARRRAPIAPRRRTAAATPEAAMRAEPASLEPVREAVRAPVSEVSTVRAATAGTRGGWRDPR